ncbi:MAG: hypothetical protein AAGG75_00865 [Bacteroidota bacterium]
MRTIKQPPFLLLLGLLLGLSACQNDDEAQELQSSNNYILEESAFGCTNYQTITIDAVFQINHTLQYENFLIFGGFDSLLIADASSNERLINTGLRVNKLLAYNNKVTVCADQGVFEIDAIPTVVEKQSWACEDVMLSSKGELLATFNGGFTTTPKIYRWDEMQGFLPFTDKHTRSCLNISQMAEAANGDIWAINCGNFVLRFRDDNFLDFFNEDDLPRTLSWQGATVLLQSYGADMVLAVKNGTGLYQVLKFRNGEWLTLFNETLSNADVTDQVAEMMLPSLEKALVRNDKLYIGTTLASCRGIHVFDITKNELLQPADYYVIKDPELEGQCINDISLTSNGDIIVTTLGNDVTIMDCN